MSEPQLMDALAAWLATAAELTLGTDVFIGDLPAEAGLASVIRATGGLSDQSSPVIAATFQITTRGPSPQVTAARADVLYRACFRALDGLPIRQEGLSADWRALALDPIQPPADLGVSEAGARKVVFNVLVRAVRITGPLIPTA